MTKRTVMVALSMLAVVSSGAVGAQQPDCDRECLEGALMRYMNAVVANAPDEAGIIKGFRQTENAEVKPTGAGVWQSVTALGEVQRQFLDPVTGQAAYFGLVEESGEPAIVSVRIKVVDERVTEAEWYIGREGAPGMAGEPGPDGSGSAPYDPEYLIANPPPAARDVPPEDRLSRESLLGITSSYFDAITAHDPDVMQITQDCRRVESGLLVTGRPVPEGSDEGYQGKTNCSSGIRTTGRLNIALVTARRYPIVDEQQQVVMGLGVFIRERGSPLRRLGLSEFFYIDDALISAVYAGMFYASPELPMPNWPPFDGNWPLPPLPEAAR